MKRRFSALALFTFIAVSLLATSMQAQTMQAISKSAAPPKYDIREEVTMTATVSRVISKATPEMKMLAGSHLILETASGKIDASLGVFPITGGGAPPISSGERVQVTGVMKTIRDQRVLVARLVLINGHSYKIRNEHGLISIPATRKGTENSETKGAQL